jgi:glycine/D-amino acid oxidase-like deaminating enzyme
MMKSDIAIVGAGIVGLAHALAAAKRGLKVVLIERSVQAVGASVRNFGLLWPIGQPAGIRHDRAMRSRTIWAEVAQQSGLSFFPTGSLHLAYRADEWQVLEEFAAQGIGAGFGRRLMTKAEIAQLHRAVRTEGLQGGLWSPRRPQSIHARQSARCQVGLSLHMACNSDSAPPCTRSRHHASKRVGARSRPTG